MLPLRDNIPTRGTAVATLALMIANCGIFLFQPTRGSVSDFTWRFAFVPAQLVKSDAAFEAGLEENIRAPVTDRYGRPLANRLTRQLITQPDVSAIEAVTTYPASLKLITSMFLHGGWMHLIGNMLFLWIFGSRIESRVGAPLYLVFYLATGVLAAVTHAWFEPDYVPLVGASGAISGLMGAYLVLHSWARIFAIVPVGWYPVTVSLPAWIYMIFYVVIQNLYPATFSSGQGGVAYLAHLGGFAAGVSLIWIVPKRPALPVAADDSVDDADVVL